MKNWIKNKMNYLRFFLLLGIVGTIILHYYFCATLNDYLIFYTFIALIWTAKETMDLKKNAAAEIYQLRKEHKTNLRPYLRLQKETGRNMLILVNEGMGVAVNLRSTFKKDNNVTQLPGITAMAAAPNSLTRGLTPARLGINFDSEDDCLIEINYKDIEGRNYRAVFKRNSEFNDKFEIMEQIEI